MSAQDRPTTHSAPAGCRPRGARALALLGALVVLLGVGPLTATASHAGAGGRTGDPSGEEVPAPVLRVASFNILGSQHTARSSRWAAGAKRAQWARTWLDERQITVAGMTESQKDQTRAIVSNSAWEAYPDPGKSTNTQTAQSVLWRTDQWRLVRARTFTIPFHYGQQRQQPMVLLEDRASAERVWVVSTHLTSGKNDRAERERREGLRLLVENIERVQRHTDFPVVVTGDMNWRDTFFCTFTAALPDFSSPAGGVRSGETCTGPAKPGIDWIMSSSELAWQDYERADGGSLDSITDHSVPVATTTLP